MIALLPVLVAVQTVPENAAVRVRRLDADLLADSSATAVLQRWCAKRRLADPPVMRAVVDLSKVKPPSAEQRARLQLGPREHAVYRRVRLMCGTHVLSDAENWYVPTRLLPQMNAALTGNTPFGTAIKSFLPSRRSLGVEHLWNGEGDVPQAVLRHRALVVGVDGTPLAEVHETYQRDLVAD
jgi:hypothetical protein